MSGEEYALTVARNDRRVVDASWEMGDDERDALILAVIRAVTPVIDPTRQVAHRGTDLVDFAEELDYEQPLGPNPAKVNMALLEEAGRCRTSDEEQA